MLLWVWTGDGFGVEVRGLEIEVGCGVPDLGDFGERFADCILNF